MSWLRHRLDALFLITVAVLIVAATAHAQETPPTPPSPYWSCVSDGWPVGVSWGSAGPPPGWSPAENGCTRADVYETPPVDEPQVEVLDGVWVPASDADAVVAYLRAHHIAAWRPVLDCIAATESGGDYTAQNRTSSASGKYQFVRRTGDFAVTLAGHPEYAGTAARLWPPEVQDAAAVALIEYQQGSVLPAWRWSGDCNALVPR